MSTGVSFRIGAGFSANGSTRISSYFKVAALPASDMTIIDLDAASTGYWRVKMASTGLITWEWYINGTANSASFFNAAPGQWHWISCAIGPTFSGLGDPGYYLSSGALYAQAGASSGGGLGERVGPGATTVTARLGWGVSLTTGYLNFPNAAGYRLSKLSMVTAGGWLDYEGPPTSDVSPASYQDLYLCRDTLGVASVLHDSSAGAADMSAGPNGLTVVADGPYA